MATRSVIFVGVNTSGSRVHELFPRWTATLGVDARIESIDLPLDATLEQYRSLVESIACDRDVIGAVITSHKLRLYAACADLFAEVDHYAAVTHEVNSLHRTARGLCAVARDPLAARAVLDELDALTDDVLCLGAGGAATAIALNLVVGKKTPRRAIFTDVRPDRLQALEATLGALGPATTRFEFVLARATDAMLASLRPGSLVVNATGLGKDVPGSPIGQSALFPANGVIWELNYRGDRPFLAQACRQQRQRRLRVHDGWLYFLHGWFQALAPILDFEPDRRLFDQFRAASA
jgi:shikimate 5-dehydrogenase